MSGWDLACRECGHRFPSAVTVGVVGAHFDVEHDGREVVMDLVMMCRCGQVMGLDHVVGEHLHYNCGGCRRSRVVHQRNRPHL